MSFLHSPYLKAWKITSSDMLYTLSVFALEPTKWIGKYEWRHFTDLELCASGTYWKAIGDAMGISFEPLPSFGAGWKDGLHWLNEVQTWSEQYERRHMIPSKTNQRLAKAHLDVIFINVPRPFLITATRFVGVLLGERLRHAMMLPAPSSTHIWLLNGLLGIRKFALRCLALPRPALLRKNYLSADPNPQTGKYSAKEYLSYPWYVTATFRRRWGPRALFTWSIGRKLPGDDGNQYLPEGYKVSEVGPKSRLHGGASFMDNAKDQLADNRLETCPFATLNKD